MRAASIDIGTNSILLLVVEGADDGGVRTIYETVEITRLGAGVDAQRRLQGSAVERSLAVVEQYARRLLELGVDRCAAVGTSALRDVANGADFTAPASELLGCAVEVISGVREAGLVQRGVGSTFAQLGATDVIFDVGGGSTEFIVTDDPPRLVSLDVGTVRLTERLVQSDPPAPAELESIRQGVAAQLDQLVEFFPTRIGRLVGVAGTVTTLATLELALEDYDSERVNGSQLSRAQVDGLQQRLAGLKLAERRDLPGLDPRRADVIVAGATLVGAVMDQLGLDTLDISDRGVRWGLVYELLES